MITFGRPVNHIGNAGLALLTLGALSSLLRTCRRPSEDLLNEQRGSVILEWDSRNG